MFLGKTVVITGGANGIGKGIAIEYLRQHANVAILDVDEKKGEAFIQSFGDYGLFIKTDVSEPAQVVAAFQKIVQQFGQIDILINNSGIAEFTPFEQLTVDNWDRILNTNLRSVFVCSQEAVKYMPNGGSIVSMASTRGLMSEEGSEAYAASKGGIIALTHALAASLKEKKITVNCISPGWIETGDYEQLREIDHAQHFSNRVGKPEDIAQACLYLTHENNNFTNGQNLIVDGGMTKKMIYEH